MFVLLGHVWGQVVAVGGYAWRLNLMSATFSAAAAGCFFLTVHALLGEGGAPRAALTHLERTAAAAGAALAAAFTFTLWQNSNETEVYTVATFSIAAMSWLCLRWRQARGTDRAAHALLLIAYLAALSIGNHLMSLLAGPAVVGFLYHVLRTAPSPDPAERRTEWSEVAVLGALWIVLIAVGLGSTRLLVLGGVLVVAAGAYAVAARSTAFPLATLAVGAAGVSTYAFLYIRSGLDPILDMADPETWGQLVAVVRRDQYGARGLLDNPLFPSGPGNPGRTPLLFAQQVLNYAQYCGWQWARALGPAGVVIALGFAALGLAGFAELRRRDRSAAWLLGMLWLVTGLGVVVYMNFKPGFSLFWDRYPSFGQHEVRERDYFFTPSFQLWGLFAGLGLVAAARRLGVAGRRAAALCVAGALVPFALNFTAASRRHGPDATAARDFAYNLLQSVEPYGVLFTLGDNDTYPVWYAQEVEGVRQDVVNVNLSLANADWYLRQLRRRPSRPYDAAAGPPFYRAAAGAPPRSAPATPVLDLPDSALHTLAPFRVAEPATFRVGSLDLQLRRGEVLGVAAQVALIILQQELPGGRPVTFAASSGRAAWAGLESRLLEQGLVFRVTATPPDTTAGVVRGLQGLYLDLGRTEALVQGVFRFGRLFDADTLALDPAGQQVAGSLAVPFLELGNAYNVRGDRARALVYFRRAYQLAPSRQLGEAVAELEAPRPPRRPGS